MKSRASTAVWLLMGLAAATMLAPGVAGATPGSVVISQIYGGGGNAGATYTHDFIELFNRSDSPVSLQGWSVQYAGATGTVWQITTLSGTIAPGRYYLVQQAQGAGGTTPLPTPDTAGAIGMAAASGKVALVQSTTALGCGADCDSATGVEDFVGYGTANDFEGSGPTPSPSNTTAALRASDGATDTDDNAVDFTAGEPNPRNSSFEPPTPTPSPSPTETPVPTPEPSPTPSPEPTPTDTPEPSPTPEPTPTDTPEPSPEPSPTPSPSPTPEPDCTITGTPDDDIIRGSNGDDVICGLDGHDQIKARSGIDTLLGGEGNDVLVGNAGADDLFGEGGDDFLKAKDAVSGNDTMDGGDGVDKCTGDPGDPQVNCP